MQTWKKNKVWLNHYLIIQLLLFLTSFHNNVHVMPHIKTLWQCFFGGVFQPFQTGFCAIYVMQRWFYWKLQRNTVHCFLYLPLSHRLRWLFGELTCLCYAVCGVLFGLASLTNLTALSSVCCLKVCFPNYGILPQHLSHHNTFIFVPGPPPYLN